MSSRRGPFDAAEMRAVFLRELGSAFAGARSARDLLRGAPGHPESVRSLRDFFHGIAGSAAAAGLPLLGRLAAACETAAAALLDGTLQGLPAAAIFDEGLAGTALVLETWWPLASAGSLDSAPDPDHPAPRILVVDDDRVSARLTDGVLRTAGFNSAFCCEPSRALEVIQRDPPDLILLDVMMPEVNGFDLCRDIRASPGLQLTPIVFLSSKGAVEQRVHGLEMGANDYLAKPFEPQELVARVRTHLLRLADARERAIRDGLTGCYNNQYFKLRLDQEIAKAAQSGDDLTLAMLDVDHFKRVNDEHGHLAGDAVLAKIALILAASVRSSDVLARYGGEEFALLLVGAAMTRAAMVTDRVRECIAAYPFELPVPGGKAQTARCTVSIGIAALCAADTAEAFLLRADRALYGAKDAGRNRVVIAA
jgi:diguanylate cyclase (GGDEF)-like protein